MRYGADTAHAAFCPPVPPAPWTGVRDALEFGADRAAAWNGGRAISEDCLHLNVWTPGLGDGAKRPVMVWFHPGAYSSGTSNELEADGARLSRRGDVVVVTVNHRLNAFGHLYLAELGGEDSPTRATPASSISCSRCSGCGTTSRRSAATPAT